MMSRASGKNRHKNTNRNSNKRYIKKNRTAQSSKVAPFQNLSTPRHQTNIKASTPFGRANVHCAKRRFVTQTSLWLILGIGYKLGTLSHGSSLCWDVWHGTFRVSTIASKCSCFTDMPFRKLLFGGHQSFSWNHWCPCFGLLVTPALGFKARVDLLTCVFHGLHVMITQIHLRSVTPADILATGMAAKSLTHIIFQAACVSRTRDISLSYLRVS